jgi:hypothetical protein
VTLRCTITAAAAATIAALGSLPAQAAATWSVHGAIAGARMVGPAAQTVHGSAPSPIALPPGDYAVHFATDAAGKPASLRFDVPAAAVVAIAVEPAPGLAEARVVATDAAEWREAAWNETHPWRAHLAGDAGDRDLRATVKVAAEPRGEVAVFARWLDEQRWYRLVWSRERHELRLERRLGAHTLVLASAALDAAERPHELTLQVEGFRLQGACDDAVLLQALDGAHDHGRAGFGASGAPGVARRPLRIEGPAPMRASAAAVAAGGSARFVAAAPVVPGLAYVLELRLDRPHPLLPLREGIVGCALLRGTAEPIVLRGDLRSPLGPGAAGAVDADGRVAAELRWPTGPALRGQAALLCAVFVAADGSAAIGRTPGVTIVL